MKRMLLITFLLSTSVVFAQADNLKTIIKDNGDSEREKVDAKKLCGEVRDDQQRLMVLIRPEFKGNITVKEAVPLEVFRADNSLGFAAKCILQFPSK